MPERPSTEALAQMAAPDRKTGFLEKQGRGRNFSPYKPWAQIGRAHV